MINNEKINQFFDIFSHFNRRFIGEKYSYLITIKDADQKSPKGGKGSAFHFVVNVKCKK